jgi:putative flavoprotein involved in K+ transport
VTAVPGLYFLGLPWLHTWGSGRFASVARDAAHLAHHIKHSTHRSRTAA